MSGNATLSTNFRHAKRHPFIIREFKKALANYLSDVLNSRMINGWRLASDSAQTFIIPRMSWMATFAARSASSRDNEGFFATNALLNCALRLLRDAASRFSRIGAVSNGRHPGRL